jgi:glycosyltransferase involved in cell wall biosynthesis/Flp pilus assembly protein TadD
MERLKQMNTRFLEKKVVSFILSSRDAYRPMLFSQNEVFCGPDCETVKKDGLFRTVKTPPGVFDIKEIVGMLPENQQPEMICVKADATGRNFPVNLKCFKCPKLLILGNTQHLKKPIQLLIKYALQEKFQFILSDHKRHHLHYFREAGFENVSWLPGFNIWPHERLYCENKVYDVSFVGQMGRWHPYRRRVLNYLARQGVPLNTLQAPHEKAAEIYAQSLINLNISLNGDLNLRIFEVLSSGGFLLTDSLSLESGLDLLFRDGEHLVCFEDEKDLVDKINYFLKHPDEAKEIARNGCEEYARNHTPQKKNKELMDYVFKGVENPLYNIKKDKRSVYIQSNSSEAIMKRVALYEFFQELHLNKNAPSVLLWPGVDALLACDLVDLPRLSIVIKEDGDKVAAENRGFIQKVGLSERITFATWEDIETQDAQWEAIGLTGSELLSTGIEEILRTLDFRWLMISDGIDNMEWGSRERLEETLAAAGFERNSDYASCYCWKEKALWGETLLSQGKTNEAVRYFERVLMDNPHDPRALRKLGLILYEQNDMVAAKEYLIRAVGLNRHDLEPLSCLAHLYFKSERFDDAYELFQEAALLDSDNSSLWFFLGRCCEQLDKRLEAIDAFTRCNEAGGAEGFKVEEKIAELTRHLTGAMSKPGSSRILSSKRILVINNLYPPQELGGYGRLLCDFAGILEKRGHTIHVLTSDTAYLGQIERDESNIDRGLLLYGGWQNGVCKQIDDNDRVIQIIKTNLEKVRSVVQRLRPELCLLGNIDFLSHIILSPLSEMSIPVVHHLGNKTPGYSVKDTPQSNQYRLATASGWLRDEIMRQGYPLKEISIIFPGALVEEFRMHVLPARDKLRIAYAGIVLPYKGPHILMDALKRLHDRGVEFFCSLAGTSTDNKFVTQLKNLVVASGMEDKIDFLGFLPREKLKAFFARHNVLVFPSIVQEAFGISQVEAMAAGLAVVSSGTGGAREIIEHGKSGLIFDSENSESLAQALSSLAENPKKWQSIAEEGRKRAIETFDIERSVDILEQEFSKLTNGQRPVDRESKQVKTEGEVMGNYDGFESQEQGASGKSAEALYEAAQRLMDNDSKKEAIGALAMFLAIYPDYALAHNDLGVLYYGEGEKEKALEHYVQATRFEPQNPVFQKNLADFYYVEQGQVEKAMELYVKVLAANPTDIEVLLILGHICVFLKNFEDAKVFYNKILELEPWNLDAREMLDKLGKGQRSPQLNPLRGTSEEAIQQGREVGGQVPEDRDQRSIRGNQVFGIGEEESRGADFVDTPDKMYQDVQGLLNNGKENEGVSALERLLKAYPDYAIAHNDLGVLCYNRGSKEEALHHYEKAAQLEPHNNTFQKNLADFYYIESGRMEEALQIYVKLLNANPTDLETLIILGQICTSLKKTDDARVFYNKVLELEPWNMDVREKLDQLGMG